MAVPGFKLLKDDTALVLGGTRRAVKDARPAVIRKVLGKVRDAVAATLPRRTGTLARSFRFNVGDTVGTHGSNLDLARWLEWGTPHLRGRLYYLKPFRAETDSFEDELTAEIERRRP